MRPITEEPGYKELLRQEREFAQQVVGLSEQLHHLALDPLLPGESIEDRAAKANEIQAQRSKAAESHLLIARSIWTLKASWK